jgi:hypothetical protein
MTTPTSISIPKLRADVNGQVIGPDDAEYDQARAVFYGGFNLWLPADDVKTRHLRRDPRATIVVAESVDPLRGVELRTEARLLDADDLSDAVRIATRYVGPEKGAEYVHDSGYDSVIARLEPGHLRVWDFDDE